MHKFLLSAALAVIPFTHASPAIRSDITPRDEIFDDVIRYFTCFLFTRPYPEEEKSPYWEKGFAAYYPKKGQTGGAEERVEFDMYTRVGDVFYNGKGTVYGGDSNKETKIWSDFMYSPGRVGGEEIDGLFIGHAERTTADKAHGYNCFLDNSFEYEDEEHGNCKQHVRCEQKDAIKIYSHATEEVVSTEDLATPLDIYSKFEERYDEAARSCDQSPVDIEGNYDCKVSFECSDNSETAHVIGKLIEMLKQYSEGKDTFKTEEKEYQPPSCIAGICGSPPPQPYTVRTMPAGVQFIARSIPSVDSREGAEVAKLKAQVTCDVDKYKDALCDALGSIFSLGGLVDKFSKVADVGGVALDVGCGFIN